ncbi:MAG: hypothetical protein ACFE8E_09650 [Candidatus Hodarchaeota archaeon]
MGDLQIKKIEFEISIPIKGLQQGKKYSLELNDNATFIEALALVDKIEMEDPTNTIFPLYEDYIYSYLQLFVNIEEGLIYDDVGVFAYAPDEDGIMRKFNPIRENIEFNLYPDSFIQLQPDVGC